MASAFSRLGKARIAAVADIDPNSRSQVAGECGAKAEYLDYHDLLVDGNVNAVVIALPHHLLAKAVIDSEARWNAFSLHTDTATGCWDMVG